jgi:hypothetical protein
MAPQYRNSAETFYFLTCNNLYGNPTTKLNSTLIKIILPPEYNNSRLYKSDGFLHKILEEGHALHLRLIIWVSQMKLHL